MRGPWVAPAAAAPVAAQTGRAAAAAAAEAAAEAATEAATQMQAKPRCAPDAAQFHISGGEQRHAGAVCREVTEADACNQPVWVCVCTQRAMQVQSILCRHDCAAACLQPDGGSEGQRPACAHAARCSIHAELCTGSALAEPSARSSLAEPCTCLQAPPHPPTHPPTCIQRLLRDIQPQGSHQALGGGGNQVGNHILPARGRDRGRAGVGAGAGRNGVGAERGWGGMRGASGAWRMSHCTPLTCCPCRGIGSRCHRSSLPGSRCPAGAVQGGTAQDSWQYRAVQRRVQGQRQRKQQELLLPGHLGKPPQHPAAAAAGAPASQPASPLPACLPDRCH